MNYEKLIYEVKDSIAYIRMNYDKNLNALDVQMAEELLKAFDDADKDPEVKVIQLSSTGRAFSSGGDIGYMYKAVLGGSLNLEELYDGVAPMVKKMREISKPTIAVLHGAVAGAAFNFSLLCDFRVASEDAVMIQSFVNISLIPDFGGIYLLSRMIGSANATRLAMLGNPVLAKEALELGLVTQVVPREELEAAADKLSKSLASKPALALANIRKMVNETTYPELLEFVEKENKIQLHLSTTEDFKEGIKAFAEKRKPNFQGK